MYRLCNLFHPTFSSCKYHTLHMCPVLWPWKEHCMFSRCRSCPFQMKPCNRRKLRMFRRLIPSVLWCKYLKRIFRRCRLVAALYNLRSHSMHNHPVKASVLHCSLVSYMSLLLLLYSLFCPCRRKLNLRILTESGHPCRAGLAGRQPSRWFWRRDVLNVLSLYSLYAGCHTIGILLL